MEDILRVFVFNLVYAVVIIGVLYLIYKSLLLRYSRLENAGKLSASEPSSGSAVSVQSAELEVREFVDPKLTLSWERGAVYPLGLKGEKVIRVSLPSEEERKELERLLGPELTRVLYPKSGVKLTV
ncbi:hypothetical protein [Thermovibrio ammonificans]|jgi:hypothetical protein|uniref:Uncharacterized protein n=1 Tax=Thermovibrio ammonificans (strain DSM 15698 / JCM 12110 / HB-1) TaxID=648996 RepID=E8T5F5_THEA1|nr:hypothetical protein [Thermovibrio ammonificans]ADU97609.1 hypothetical protein Theam_1653 [Thermovibrio ammonificans HB-1]